MSAPEIDLAEADPFERIRKLERINEALINRVERPLHEEANAYSLFQTAISLEAEIFARTSELNEALNALERTNSELEIAHETLSAANAMRSRFFTAVGHDALQPLHAARLSLSTLGEMSQTRPQRQLVSQIDHSLTSIEEIIKTVLDIARLEAGVMMPKLAPVPLADFFERLHDDFAPQAAHKGLSFTLPITNLVVHSDALMLRRIVQNLVANAVRYTKEGRVRILVKQRGENLRLEVWDTGCGIRPQDMRLIFNEFQRGSDLNDGGDPGLGLGLSIVKRMADVLEHPLGVISHSGRGSCFHISVPLWRSEIPREQDAGETPANRPFGLRQAHLVIVDNNEASLVALAALLRQWHCTPNIASDIETLANYATVARVPDLIIADFHLDRGELGTDAVRLLRERFCQHIPAIILTADRSACVAEIIRNAGCELMNKPARPAELRALVSHLLT